MNGQRHGSRRCLAKGFYRGAKQISNISEIVPRAAVLPPEPHISQAPRRRDIHHFFDGQVIGVFPKYQSDEGSPEFNI